MKTLTMDKEKLVDALMSLNQAGAIRDTLPYMVAFNPDNDAPKARVIWADTPSSMGGYVANFVGEENIMPDAFLTEGNDYHWGEDEDEESDPGPAEAARDWITENLLDFVDLDDLGIYNVEYI